MHYAAVVAISLLLMIPSIFAAPTSSSYLATPSHPPIESSPAHTSLSLSFSSSHHHSTHTASRPPPHFNTPAPASPSTYELDPEGLQVQQRQKKLAIALGVVAGFVSFGFLACIIRCLCRYKAPPKRDRIAEILQRHNLQCELEELERHPHVLRRPSLRDPAPPYSPRPPSYTESVIGTVRPAETGRPAQTETKASQHVVPLTQVHLNG
jgi:hypothetical protein